MTFYNWINSLFEAVNDDTTNQNYYLWSVQIVCNCLFMLLGHNRKSGLYLQLVSLKIYRNNFSNHLRNTLMYRFLFYKMKMIFCLILHWTKSDNLNLQVWPLTKLFIVVLFYYIIYLLIQFILLGFRDYGESYLPTRRIN